jgi:hypothetical protein
MSRRRWTTPVLSIATPASPRPCPHIPDKVDDYTVLLDYIGRRVRQSINVNTFQDDDYAGPSAPSAEIRAKALDALIECCRIAAATDAPAVKVWLGDGTNYPGQDDLRWRRNRLVEGLRQAYEHLPPKARMYLEYKIFEPAIYSTDVQDWGQSLAVCNRVGERAVVCVDTGHHSLGVNIEQIVALLLAEGKLGSFDLNDKKYGDDDLMVGSVDPYQMFRITHELINAMRDDTDPVAQKTAHETVYMLDQCHNIGPRCRPSSARHEPAETSPSPARRPRALLAAHGGVTSRGQQSSGAPSSPTCAAPRRAAPGARPAAIRSRLSRGRRRRAPRTAWEARPPPGRVPRRSGSLTLRRSTLPFRQRVSTHTMRVLTRG